MDIHNLVNNYLDVNFYSKSNSIFNSISDKIKFVQQPQSSPNTSPISSPNLSNIKEKNGKSFISFSYYKVKEEVEYLGSSDSDEEVRTFSNHFQNKFITSAKCENSNPKSFPIDYCPVTGTSTGTSEYNSLRRNSVCNSSSSERNSPTLHLENDIKLKDKTFNKNIKNNNTTDSKESIKNSTSDPSKRKRGRPKSNRQKVCSICFRRETPEWRKLNGVDLCNACGLKQRGKQKKLQRVRVQLSLDRLSNPENSSIDSIQINEYTTAAKSKPSSSG